MKKYKQNGDLYLVVSVVVMAVLFYSSSQTYEQQTSVPLLEKLLKNEPLKAYFSRFSITYAGAIISVKEVGYYKFVEFFIRKGAHFFSYFILGGSFLLGLRPKIGTTVLAILFSWLSATGYAAIDEFHQLLTGDRTPLFQDVMLDSVGALTACIFFLIGSLWLNRSKGKKR